MGGSSSFDHVLVHLYNLDGSGDDDDDNNNNKVIAIDNGDDHTADIRRTRRQEAQTRTRRLDAFNTSTSHIYHTSANCNDVDGDSSNSIINNSDDDDTTPVFNSSAMEHSYAQESHFLAPCRPPSADLTC